MKQLFCIGMLLMIICFSSCHKKVGEIIWGSNWEDTVECWKYPGKCKEASLAPGADGRNSRLNRSLPAKQPAFFENGVYDQRFPVANGNAVRPSFVFQVPRRPGERTPVIALAGEMQYAGRSVPEVIVTERPGYVYL